MSKAYVIEETTLDDDKYWFTYFLDNIDYPCLCNKADVAVCFFKKEEADFNMAKIKSMASKIKTKIFNKETLEVIEVDDEALEDGSSNFSMKLREEMKGGRADANDIKIISLVEK
jgi:hypothetical protein